MDQRPVCTSACTFNDRATRLEERLVAMHQTLERIDAGVQKQNGRVRDLEAFTNKLVGGLTLIGVVLTIIGAAVVKLLTAG